MTSYPKTQRPNTTTYYTHRVCGLEFGKSPAAEYSLGVSEAAAVRGSGAAVIQRLAWGQQAVGTGLGSAGLPEHPHCSQPRTPCFGSQSGKCNAFCDLAGEVTHPHSCLPYSINHTGPALIQCGRDQAGQCQSLGTISRLVPVPNTTPHMQGTGNQRTPSERSLSLYQAECNGAHCVPQTLPDSALQVHPALKDNLAYQRDWI